MKPSINALDRLLEVVVLINDDMEQSLAADGLTPPRAQLVWRLAEGPLTQAALAESMRVTPRNVTGLVDGLVATGFVTREPHPTDRRATLVQLTTHGKEVVAGFQQGQVELAELLFGDLSDRQLAAFQTGIDHVVDVLRGELSK